MAKGRKPKQASKAKADEERLRRSLSQEDQEAEPEPSIEAGDDASQESDEADEDREGQEASEGTDQPSDASDQEESDESDDQEEIAAAQLGTDRYVIAGFFAAAMLFAYVLGKAIHGIWATLSNRAWFSLNLPTLAAVGDDDKLTYGTIMGAIIALVVVLRIYRNPEIRTWTDEVAAELAKVKWPSRKEVTNWTFIVLAASTVATLYLALLDRLWSFVTDIVYSTGS